MRAWVKGKPNPEVEVLKTELRLAIDPGARTEGAAESISNEILHP